MNKKKLHHAYTKLRGVNYWYFLVGFIFFGTLFVYSYRQNNLRMIQLRDAVFEADETNTDLEESLRELRSFVYGHMNTDLTSSDTAIKPPIQLKYQYERLSAAEKTRADQANASVRREAEAICAQRFPVTANVTGREPCIQGILDERGANANSVPKELYQFDFLSPRWSPDVAGWSLVLAMLFGLLFITRFSLEFWLRRQFRQHS
jgi:hypothetical protein